MPAMASNHIFIATPSRPPAHLHVQNARQEEPAPLAGISY
jgi:hypothetical protein